MNEPTSPQPNSAEEQGENEGGQGGLPELINQIGQGLTDLASGLQQAGAPKELVQGAAQILQAYTQYVQQLSQGAQGGEPSGPQSMEGGAQGVPAGDPRMRG